ncbi:D-alanyl-D-alanine carboxypeptidase [Bombiscardovia nodaiensis]|uniref:D-alanyl-D-alanine carboxypeptidase n=1 Tax=Bombiscardovia nodaiensis TaxID=2932181 RepID=A0ABM8B6X9_9BIFI|nr:D-alanyl-D-alanine carboxypeptidase [Bombiscardovia nodaiensis]
MGEDVAEHADESTWRTWRILISALLVLILFAAYACADYKDWLPGPLTATRQAPATASRTSLQALAPAAVTRQVEPGKPIDPAAAQAVVDAFAGTAGLGTDFSLMIANANGTVAAQRNQDQAREPASTLKTLTAAAAASSLDMASRLNTDVVLEESSTASPLLTLRGHGDMLLGTGSNDLEHVNGRAGLQSLAQRTAQELKRKGLSGVRLEYDASLFGSERSPAAIASNNPDGVYFTPTSAMAIDEGRVRSAEDRAASPDARGVYLPHSDDPEAQVAQTFAQALTQEGIKVEGQPTSSKESVSGKPLAQVSSAPLNEIMTYMLRTSDNTLAELFGRLTALKISQPNTPQGATEAVAKALQGLGIKTNGMHMADCSGLSPGSQVSVATLTAIQTLACDGQHSQLAPLIEGLSVVGLVGTAENRGQGDESDGLVRVKTGSLDQVTSLAGNVSRRSGGVLTFAVIVNNPQDMGAAVKAVNTLMSALPGL